MSCVADLSTPDGWSHAVVLTNERFGRIDALVNCAGATECDGRECGNTAEIARVMKSSVEVSILGARAVLPVMIRQRRPGVIVTIGSLGADLPMPGRELYTAAKFALRGFSRSLDAALRRTSVRACLLQPGPVWTSMLDGEMAEGRDPLTLAVAPVSAERVARSVARMLEHPRAELIMPGWDSELTRVVGAFPSLFRALLPQLERVGVERPERGHHHRTASSGAIAFRSARVAS